MVLFWKANELRFASSEGVLRLGKSEGVILPDYIN